MVVLLLSSLLIWPVDSQELKLKFGDEWPHMQDINGQYHRHAGLDIGSPYLAPVYAVADGEVIFRSEFSILPGMQGICIYHPELDLTTIYWHIRPQVFYLDKVKQQDIIGLVEGFGDNVHLHFAVWKGRAPQVRPPLALPITGLVKPAFPAKFVDPLFYFKELHDGSKR